METQNIIAGVQKDIIQAMPGCSSDDVVTIKVTRLSDRFTWDFTEKEFVALEKTGSMVFVSDISWKGVFTPDTAGTYIAYIKNVTLDTEYSINLIVDSDPIIIPSGSWGDALAVGTNTFCTGVEAETYYATRWGASAFWDVLTNAQKTSALITAYNQIKKAGVYELPDVATSAVKMGQLEQALFLVIHGTDALSRAGLIAQGVESSTISKESYDSKMRGRLAVCPETAELLQEYYVRSEGNFTLQLERDDSV